jgi:hypothetical protein
MIFRVAEQREVNRQQAAAAMMALGADLMQSVSPPHPKKMRTLKNGRPCGAG